MTVLGGLCLWIAFLVGIWGALAGFVGGRQGRRDLEQSARHAVFAMCVALWVAVAALEWALFQHDFNVEYVASYTSRNLPIFYTWSALYAGQKGSLLFWASVLSLFGSLAMVLTGRRHRALLPYVAGVVCTVATYGSSARRSEEHTSELQSHSDLVCRLLLEKKKQKHITEP